MRSAAQYWVGPGLLLVLLCLTQTPQLSPDALEMSLVGRGYLGFESQGLDLSYYPPLFPLLSALLGLLLGGQVALVAINLLCILTLVWLFQRMLLRQGADGIVGLVVALIGFSLLPLREMAVGADPRALQLLLLFLGIFLLRPAPSLTRTKLLGVLAALLLMCRPEGLLFAGLLLGGALYLWRKMAVTTIVFFLGFVLPYFLWISRSLGGFSLSTRAWELKGAALLPMLPVRPLIQLWGTGASSTPYREMLQQVDAGSAVPRSGFVEAFAAAIETLGSGLPLFVLGLALFGAFRFWRSGERFLLAMLCGVLGLSLALYLVPMGRDLALPLINLLPAVVAIWLLASCGALRLVGMLRGRLPLPRALIVVLLLAPTGYWSVNGSAASTVPQEASSWLKSRLEGEVRVASSLGSSAIVRRAGLHWERIPARWERKALWGPATEPDYLLFSSIDGSWMLGPPLMDARKALLPVAFFQDHGSGDWVLILDLNASRRQVDQAPVVLEALEQGELGEESPGNLEEAGGDLPAGGALGP